MKEYTLDFLTTTAIKYGTRLITIEFSLASHSSFFDILTLGFTMPLPPNCFASLFRISLYFPANGTPRRNFSCSTETKLQTKSSVSSGLSVFLSKKEEWDARENSIVINLATMSVAIFSCTPYEEEPVTGKKKPAEKKKRPAKQPSVKIPASPLDVISEKVGQIKKTARESQTGKRNKG